jgi:lipopolysaccharide heptosyltransferase I
MTKIKNKEIKKILIVKPSSLGDIFHCFAAVSLLGEAFPDARFDWFVRPEFEDAIEYSPVKINRIIHFPRRKLGKLKTFLPAFIKVINELRKEKYDLIVDFQGLLRSAIFTSLARSTKSVGFALPKESAARLAYNDKIKIPDNIVHAVDRNIALAEAVTGLKFSNKIPLLPKVKEFQNRINELLKTENISSGDKIIGMIPGARWESKCWPPEFFAKVAEEFLKSNPEYKILIIGSPADQEAGKEIVSNASCKNIVSIAGKTSVGEMIEAIRQCEFIFSNDSGPIHIAAAFGIKVFALFGPTDPDKTGPYGDIHSIFQRRVDCIKCLKRICPGNNYKCHDFEISKIVDNLNKYTNSGGSNENQS